MNAIGFMQGRLSPMVSGRIQAFPWDHWREEFALAQQGDLHVMEWTLDDERLHENPLLTNEGRAEARALSKKHDMSIASLTADFWMQAPFYKANGAERDRRLNDFRAVIEACSALRIRWIIAPLVDNGTLENDDHRRDVARVLNELVPFLERRGVGVAFESDFPPTRLADLMRDFPAPHFGVNYDSGNSASLGYDAAEEFAAYGDRIVNVHIKDRILGGTTVPLGEGSVDFDAVFRGIVQCDYGGALILQTARAADGDHLGALLRYRDRVRAWLDEALRGS